MVIFCNVYFSFPVPQAEDFRSNGDDFVSVPQIIAEYSVRGIVFNPKHMVVFIKSMQSLINNNFCP